jgi:hypothetical protein
MRLEPSQLGGSNDAVSFVFEVWSAESIFDVGLDVQVTELACSS